MNIADYILFAILAVVAIAAAIAMLTSRNAVYAALYLIINFGTIAVFYLILGAPFIAMAQITVYAGAIMVLFLFVIMLIGSVQPHRLETNLWQQPLAILLGLVLMAEVIFLLVRRAGNLPLTQSVDPSWASPTAIASLLFNQYLLPFEVTSILLLVAMIGAIVLTQIEKKRQNP